MGANEIEHKIINYLHMYICIPDGESDDTVSLATLSAVIHCSTIPFTNTEPLFGTVNIKRDSMSWPGMNSVRVEVMSGFMFRNTVSWRLPLLE